MEERKIKCYLCESEANQEEGYDTSRNVRINCPKCTKYELTDMAIKFYFKRDNGKELLNQEDKEKLSEYVRRHYNPEKVIPVRIDIKMIEVLTGKKSIND